MIAVLGARLPRSGLLVALMGAFAVANAASALAGDYGQLVLARFLSGVPHGAYFGVASVVAAALVPANRRASAVTRVMLGLTVANIVGVLAHACPADDHVLVRGWPQAGEDRAVN